MVVALDTAQSFLERKSVLASAEFLRDSGKYHVWLVKSANVIRIIAELNQFCLWR